MPYQTLCFCNFEMLVKAEEERPEEIWFADRRLESSKNETTVKGKYTQEAFKKDANGDFVCP